jgi:hypothetical protein
MKSAKVPIVLIAIVLFFSCNDDRNRPQATPQLLIPRERMQYDSSFLLPTYTNKGTITQNTNLSQSSITPTDSLAAATLSYGKQNMSQPFDTAAVLLSRGLNPPHGAPGHRCDLQIGAPLNSKPEIKTTKQGLNPPHGQPGHRCDIAVGAPLNSKPVTVAANQNIPVANKSMAADSVNVDSLKN